MLDSVLEIIKFIPKSHEQFFFSWLHLRGDTFIFIPSCVKKNYSMNDDDAIKITYNFYRYEATPYKDKV